MASSSRASSWDVALAAFLTSAGIISPVLWWFVLPGVAVLFWTLQFRVVRIKEALLVGGIFGVVTGCAGTIWFWDTLPLSFLGIDEPSTQIIAIGMTWLYVGASLAISVPLAALVIFKTRGAAFFPLSAGIVWAFAEYFRMWGFAFATVGPKSLFGPHFSSAAVGYSLMESPSLRALAAPFGLDGLNFLVGFVAALLVWLVDKECRARRLSLGLVQITIVATVFCLYPQEGASRNPSGAARSLRFAVISGNLDTVRESSTHETLLQELSTAVSAVPPVDVVLLPEEVSLTSLFWSRAEYEDFKGRYIGDRDLLIMNSRNNLFPEEERNESAESKKLIYDSTRGGEVARYIKQMLMPLGEYAPSFTETFFSIVPDPQLHTYLGEVAVIDEEFTKDLSVGEFRGVRIGGLLCSDLFSPYLYRELVTKHGAEVLVNLANHFWFHGSRTLYWKMVQMARVHAVWNRRALLISNNISPSLVISAQGDTISESRWGGRGVMYYSLEL